jgi:hypothetical protein
MMVSQALALSVVGSLLPLPFLKLMLTGPCRDAEVSQNTTGISHRQRCPTQSTQTLPKPGGESGVSKECGNQLTNDVDAVLSDMVFQFGV